MAELERIIEHNFNELFYAQGEMFTDEQLVVLKELEDELEVLYSQLDEIVRMEDEIQGIKY